MSKTCAQKRKHKKRMIAYARRKQQRKQRRQRIIPIERLRTGLRQLSLARETRLRNPHLNYTEKPTKKGIFGKIKSLFARKKGPK